MKKVFYFLLLFGFTLNLQAQKHVRFVHETSYFFLEYNSYKKKTDTINIKVFHNKKGDIALLTAYDKRKNKSLLIYKGVPYIANVSLNECHIKKAHRYYSNISEKSFINAISNIVKTNTTDKISGIPCEYYTFDIDGKLFKVCMSKKHPLNSLKVISDRMSDKGLMVKLVPEKGKDNEFLQLHRYRKVNISVPLDIEKEIAQFNKELKILKSKPERTEAEERVKKAIEVAKKTVENVKKTIEGAAKGGSSSSKNTTKKKAVESKAK